MQLLNLYDDFMTILYDFSLVQMVTEPTRHKNVLDLLLTTNHTLVKKTEFLPGIADHDIMVADVNNNPQVGRQKPSLCTERLTGMVSGNIFQILPLILR